MRKLYTHIKDDLYQNRILDIYFGSLNETYKIEYRPRSRQGTFRRIFWFTLWTLGYH